MTMMAVSGDGTLHILMPMMPISGFGDQGAGQYIVTRCWGQVLSD